MRDFIICDIRQTLLGEMGYVIRSDRDVLQLAGDRDLFSSPKTLRPPLAPHPSVQLVPGILSLWVKWLGGQGVTLTTHPCLSGGLMSVTVFLLTLMPAQHAQGHYTLLDDVRAFISGTL